MLRSPHKFVALIILSCLFVDSLRAFAACPATPEADRTVRLLVHVVEHRNDRPVPFATVWLNGKAVAQADSTGRATLELRVTTDTLLVEASALGYSREKRAVAVGTATVVTVELRLQVSPVPMPSVAVEAPQPTLMHKGTRLRLGTTLLQSPQLWSGDVLRIAQLVPGSVLRTDVTTRLYLGGGDYYQTAVLWNGLPLFNTAHFGGMIGALTATEHDSVVIDPVAPSFNAGPGWLSGSIELWTRPQPGIGLDANPLSTTITYGRSASKWRLDLRGRAVQYELAFRAAKTKVPYFFRDLGFDASYFVSRRTRIRTAFYLSRDGFYTGASRSAEGISPNWWEATWSSTAYRLDYSSRLSSDTHLLLTLLGSASSLNGAGQSDVAAAQIGWGSVGGSIQLRALGGNLQAGMYRSQLRSTHHWRISYPDLWNLVSPPSDIFFDFAPLTWHYRASVSYTSVLLTFSRTFTPWNSRIEARLDRLSGGVWSPTGGFRLNYEHRKWGLGLAGGTRSQYLYTVKQIVNAPLSDPFAAYFLTDPRRALRSFYCGVTSWRAIRGAEVGVLGYGKLFFRIPFADPVGKQMDLADGASFGATVWLQSSQPRYAFGIWVDLSKALLSTGRGWFPAPYDRSTQIRFSLVAKPARRLHLSLAGYALSGLAYTRTDRAYFGVQTLYRDPVLASVPSQVDVVSNELPFVPEKRPFWSRLYGSRTPPYARLDVGAEYRLCRFLGRIVWAYVRVFNVTNRRNPIGYEWAPGTPGDIDTIRGLPFLPMIGVRLGGEE